ncbi:hypothetical protein J6590_021612 [Homalodisca vitripennis]|nr:hypothetical protein J6590_021612 [Homalodisca vitripennis]
MDFGTDYRRVSRFGLKRGTGSPGANGSPRKNDCRDVIIGLVRVERRKRAGGRRGGTIAAAEGRSDFCRGVWSVECGAEDSGPHRTVARGRNTFTSPTGLVPGRPV